MGGVVAVPRVRGHPMVVVTGFEAPAGSRQGGRGGVGFFGDGGDAV